MTSPSKPLRMRDLTREAQLSRQAIHFYISEGLLPPPVSTGRNVAAYSEDHLNRLRWIQKLQREHFLSLSAIKAVLNGDGIDGFSPEQEQLLRRLRDQLPVSAKSRARSDVSIVGGVDQKLSADELQALVDAKLVKIEGSGPDRQITQDDSDIIDCYVRYRDVGATGERGYRPDHLAIMDEAVEGLVQRLARIYAAHWADAPIDEAAAFVEAVLPIDERFLGVLLRKKFRELIDRTPTPMPSDEIDKE